MVKPPSARRNTGATNSMVLEALVARSGGGADGPTQAVVATIVTDANDYAEQVVEKLKAAGIRVEADLRNEKINYKVREHSVGKVPNILVVGMREAEEGKVALRRLGQKQQEFLTVDEAVEMLREEALAPDMKKA